MNPQPTVAPVAPITPEEVQALRDALAKATPGEWTYGESGGVWADGAFRVFISDRTAEGDTAFITLAHNLAPKLLAALDAAEAEIEKLNRSIAITSNREDNAVRKWLGEQFTFTFAKRRNLSSDGQYHETPEQYVLVEADTAMAALRNALGLTRVAEANAKEAEAKAVEFAWDAFNRGTRIGYKSPTLGTHLETDKSTIKAAEYLEARGLLKRTGERMWQRVESGK